MNQLSEMLKESNARMRTLMKAIHDGKPVNLEVFAAAQREYEAQIKQVNVIIQAYAVASKNKRTLTGLAKMNVLDESTAVDLRLGDPAEDKVKCPFEPRLITREECLDRSGEKKHQDECSGCETGRMTKAKMLPETP